MKIDLRFIQNLPISIDEQKAILRVIKKIESELLADILPNFSNWLSSTLAAPASIFKCLSHVDYAFNYLDAHDWLDLGEFGEIYYRRVIEFTPTGKPRIDKPSRAVLRNFKESITYLATYVCLISTENETERQKIKANLVADQIYTRFYRQCSVPRKKAPTEELTREEAIRISTELAYNAPPTWSKTRATQTRLYHECLCLAGGRGTEIARIMRKHIKLPKRVGEIGKITPPISGTNKKPAPIYLTYDNREIIELIGDESSSTSPDDLLMFDHVIFDKTGKRVELSRYRRSRMLYDAQKLVIPNLESAKYTRAYRKKIKTTFRDLRIPYSISMSLMRHTTITSHMRYEMLEGYDDYLATSLLIGEALDESPRCARCGHPHTAQTRICSICKEPLPEEYDKEFVQAIEISKLAHPEGNI